MIEFSEEEVYTTLPEEKKVHRIGTDVYFTRCTRLESDTIEDFEEVNIEPSPTPEPLLENAKREKIDQLMDYDSSPAVNVFSITVDGTTMENLWITPEQRSNYKNSLDSAELLGMEVVHPVFNGVMLELPVSTAKMALAQIQIYADRCYGVTETHKANINALESVEAVNAYDFTTGYPEKLTFIV